MKKDAVNMSKPFALLIARPYSPLVDSETDSYKYYGRLADSELESIKLSDVPTGHIELDRYAGVIVTGSLFDYCAPEHKKTTEQKATEHVLSHVIKEAMDRDYPLLGVCYGLHIMGAELGTPLTSKYGEPLSVPNYFLSDDGKKDPIFGALPERFDAVTGHHYSLAHVPEGSTLLASSRYGEVQALRVGENVYGTQFHPEIDADGLELRITFYSDSYCEGAEEVRAQAQGKKLATAARIITSFVDHYRQ